MRTTPSAEAHAELLAPRESRYIPTLDGWRAVAIVIVMLQHASDQIRRTIGSWTEPVTSLLRDNGRFGVYIFFAISGFLITSLLLGEWQRSGRPSLRAFYIRRAFRILPPVVVVLAALGLLGAAGILPIPTGKWLSTLAFANNYAPLGGSWYLGHFWSLAIEEHFYLVWPVILCLAGPRRAFRICVALIIAVAVWRFVDLQFAVTSHWSINYQDRTDTQADGLMWGCLLALAFLRAEARSLVARITRGSRYWAILAVLVATQFRTFSTAAAEATQLALRPILVALLVIATVVAPERPLGRTLERSAVRWLGRISFSLYLWQQIFLVWDGFGVDALRRVQAFPLGVICAVGMAAISYRFVEQPAVRVGRRLAASRRPPLVVAAT